MDLVGMLLDLYLENYNVRFLRLNTLVYTLKAHNNCIIGCVRQ